MTNENIGTSRQHGNIPEYYQKLARNSMVLRFCNEGQGVCNLTLGTTVVSGAVFWVLRENKGVAFLHFLWVSEDIGL